MTDELKKAIESAHTEEEKKAVAEKFKAEMKKLSDGELEQVSGGKGGRFPIESTEMSQKELERIAAEIASKLSSKDVQ